MWLVALFLLLAVVDIGSAQDDFYELLGVDKSATSREIRKAFKKVALEKHPDKNQVIRNSSEICPIHSLRTSSQQTLNEIHNLFILCKTEI